MEAQDEQEGAQEDASLPAGTTALVAELLATMSHELRTPLATIKAYEEAMCEQCAGMQCRGTASLSLAVAAITREMAHITEREAKRWLCHYDRRGRRAFHSIYSRDASSGGHPS